MDNKSDITHAIIGFIQLDTWFYSQVNWTEIFIYSTTIISLLLEGKRRQSVELELS